jgi:hypothetical protein
MYTNLMREIKELMRKVEKKFPRKPLKSWMIEF